MCLCRSRTPSFFFVREKERGGRKKKPYPTDAREKDTSNFSVLSTRDCDRAVGETPTGRTRLRPVLHPPCRKYILKNIRRYSSQQRLSAGKRVLFPRYERADARSILERSPKLYNPVGSPRLRTASPINQARIPPQLAATFYGIPYGLGGLSRRDRQGQSVPLCLFVLLVQRSPWGVGRPTFRCVW